MMNNLKTIFGSSQSAAKLVWLLLALVALPLVLDEKLNAQSPPAERTTQPSALLNQLNGTKWDWTSLSNNFKGAVTFKGTSLEFGWGGSGSLTPATDPLTLELKTVDGVSMQMIFDPFYTSFKVMQNNRTVAMGKKPKEAAAPVAASSGKSIKLRSGWDSPMQGGSATLEDLAAALNGIQKPYIPMTDQTEIYNGVKFLMPLREAITALGLAQRPPSAKRVVCPGIPANSFEYVSFDGIFEGHYNRMDLVTDIAGQVVCVQLVDEHPKREARLYSFESRAGDWHTYNFIGYRTKAKKDLKITYQVWQRSDSKTWLSLDTNLSSLRNYRTDSLIRADSLLHEKDKMLEEVRWYVPYPMVELILQCIKKGTR